MVFNHLDPLTIGRALILDGFLKIIFRPGFKKLLMFGIVVDRRFRFCFAELKIGQDFCPLQNAVLEAKHFQSLPILKFLSLRSEVVVLFASVVASPKVARHPKCKTLRPLIRVAWL